MDGELIDRFTGVLCVNTMMALATIAIDILVRIIGFSGCRI